MFGHLAEPSKMEGIRVNRSLYLSFYEKMMRHSQNRSGLKGMDNTRKIKEMYIL